MVKLGINPITWSNDDMPELGGDTPLETCLAETRQAGFSGTELGGKFPRTAAELGPLLAKHDLQLVSGWFDGRLADQSVEDEWTYVLPHLTLLRDLGCSVIVYADTSRRADGGLFKPISQRPMFDDHEWDDYGRKLTTLAERMADFGIAMAFHHHMGTLVETPAEIDRLMATTGQAVGLLFDSGHTAFAGGDPAAVAARFAERIVHVHCKDTRAEILTAARATDRSFMQSVLDGIFTVPGDGSIDYATILSTLHHAGYEGWLVVEAEQDPAKAHPLTYATMGHDNLLRLARAAGFTVEEPATHGASS